MTKMGLRVCKRHFQVLALSSLVGCAARTDGFAMSDHKATIRPKARGSEISFLVVQPQVYRQSDGQILVSVEVPVEAGAMQPEVYAMPFSPAGRAVKNGARSSLAAASISGVTFPPGPDNATIWKTFTLDASATSKLEGGPVEFRIVMAANIPFTRILLGRPSTIGSRVIGAFPEQPPGRGKYIEPGMDYLGTASAAQHFRIPAGALAPGTEAFDSMVEFGDAPFEPQRSNIDTMMLRTARILPGQTTPVRLLRFANRSKKPIRIKGPNGDMEFAVTATLSLNAESGGFMTILPDGRYQSTTSLYPVLEFQRLNAGSPVGEPIAIDTALVPVPGFPFYLASKGGRWAEAAPVGRSILPMNSNFFYDNGPANNFIHSNGPGGSSPLGACAKSTAAMFGP